MGNSLTAVIGRWFLAGAAVLGVSGWVSATPPGRAVLRPSDSMESYSGGERADSEYFSSFDAGGGVIAASRAAYSAPPPVPERGADSCRHWYLGTNGVAWAMLVANMRGELDLGRHWSAMLPVYFSGWDYFRSTVKFRVFAVLPEVRCWFSPDNNGLFAGVHGGFCYFNYADGGGTRYQDHGADTPALGGGIVLGWRLRPRGGNPLQVEFSLGAGVYRLDYDTFRNGRGGLHTGRHRRTFFGIDNVGVTLCYRFDRRQRKEGSR